MSQFHKVFRNTFFIPFHFVAFHVHYFLTTAILIVLTNNLAGYLNGVDKVLMQLSRSCWLEQAVSRYNPSTRLWGGTIPPHLRPSGDGVLRNEVVKDEEGTLP